MSTESNAGTPSPLAANGAQLQILSGTKPKPFTGSLTIDFHTPFSGYPTVVVSPLYTDGQVGSVETITSVGYDSFTVDSQNASDGYYVSWIAVGSPLS